MKLKEKYGEYIYLHHRPQVESRADWEAYTKRSKEMQAWCNAQKFDHWGLTRGNNDLFWFNREEDYMMFLLRWS